MKPGKRITDNRRLPKFERRYDGNYLSTLERDDYRCVACDREDFVVVHHKDRNVKNNSTDNLVTLCRSCHGKEHFRLRQISSNRERLTVWDNLSLDKYYGNMVDWS